MLKFIFPVMATLSMFASCIDNKTTDINAVFQLDTLLSSEQKSVRRFTPEVMWKMGRASSGNLSPDGQRLLYSLTRYNLEQNLSSSVLYTQHIGGGAPTQITNWGYHDNSAQWSSDGKSIYFSSNRSSGTQVWKMNVKSKSLKKISSVQNGVNGFEVNSAENKIWYCTKVPVEKNRSSELFTDMPKSKALVYDDLMSRHWDRWENGSYSHLFVGDLSSSGINNATDITPNEPWDIPTAPYYDNSEIAWNNSGTALVYTARKLTGYEYSISTNTDLYLYDVKTETTINITEGMPGYDKYPRFSPDDKHIAWQSMERAGNESDKNRLFIMNADGNNKRYLTPTFDYNAYNIVWGESSKELFFISPIEATYQICKVNLKGKVQVLTSGDHDYTDFSKVGGSIIAGKTTLSMANEFFTIDRQTGEDKQLSFINKYIYDNVDFGKVEKRWITTTDNKQMLTWIILPPNFDMNKKYPTLLYCQGGPQSTVSQRWSYRWNYQLMSSEGYVVVAPNRRGLPSFGQEWLEQISGDYSGQNIEDYLSAIDEVAKEKWVAKDKIGCVGASYGGYSVFYLAGHHQKRFKAMISHCGIFNFTSMYGSTEELWFLNKDYGGAYWDYSNKTAMRSYANSPHHFVNKWDTPMLIITGVKDYRIPYTQSLEAFTAARAHGVPSRLLVFEDEAHQVFKPQNNIVWNREFFGWLDKYLKQ